MSVPVAFAEEGDWYNQNYKDWYQKVYDTEQPTEIFGERYTHAQVQWIIYSLVAIVTGVDDDLQHCIVMETGDFGNVLDECRGEFLEAICRVAVSGVAENACTVLGWVAYPPAENSPTPLAHQTFQDSPFLTTVTSNPVSSVAYFRDIGQRLNLIPEAQAQEAGFGFTAANSMLSLWRKVRNLTYALLVIVMVAMAFMIMFRVRLSPQTVITVQSALPRVILTLILITFSYAIAGLLIDLMYVVIGLIAGILTSGGDSSISNFSWSMMFNALTNRWVFSYIFLYSVWFVPALYIAVLSSGWLGALVGLPLVVLMAPLIFLVVGVIFLLVSIRIVWLLFRTFVIVMLLIIVGPVQILLGTFTGGGFTSWLRNIVAHLAVYPTVGIMFVLSFIFLRGAYADLDSLGIPFWDTVLTEIFPLEINQQFGGSTNWVPPLTGTSSAQELAWLGASFVIMTMIPHAGNMIQGFLSGRPFAMGTALGTAIGGARQLGGLGAGEAERRTSATQAQASWQAQQAKMIRDGASTAEIADAARAHRAGRELERIQRWRRTFRV